MRAPRILRISASEAVQRSWPSNRMRPLSIVTLSGTSRMMALAMIDLPDPDSPTTQTSSLAAIASDTLLNACVRSAPCC